MALASTCYSKLMLQPLSLCCVLVKQCIQSGNCDRTLIVLPIVAPPIAALPNAASVNLLTAFSFHVLSRTALPHMQSHLGAAAYGLDSDRQVVVHADG